MKLLTFLLSLPLLGASLVIDSGSDADQYFVGGTAFPSGAINDTTLRFGTFSYKIPAVDGVPCIVKFNFYEPSPLPPARVFSITINDQLVYPRITMGPGPLLPNGTPVGPVIPFSRSVVVMSSDGMLNISFNTIIRSAVVSSIEVTPLFQSLVAFATGVPPGWTGEGKQDYVFTLPDGTRAGPYIAVQLASGYAWVKQ